MQNKGGSILPSHRHRRAGLGEIQATSLNRSGATLVYASLSCLARRKYLLQQTDEGVPKQILRRAKRPGGKRLRSVFTRFGFARPSVEVPFISEERIGCAVLCSHAD